MELHQAPEPKPPQPKDQCTKMIAPVMVRRLVIGSMHTRLRYAIIACVKTFLVGFVK